MAAGPREIAAASPLRLRRGGGASIAPAMGYEAHERLVAPARPSAGLLRLVIGCGAVAVIFVMLSLFVASLQQQFLPTLPEALPGPGSRGNSTVSALVNLFLFALLIIALWLALRLVHDRPLTGLLGPRPLALRQFGRVFLALLPVFAVALLLPMPAAFSLTPNLGPGLWLALLPLSLAGLLIQTAAEELVFRGYLQSQLAARFPLPPVWIVLPSLAFAALHYDPAVAGGGGGAWLVMIWALLFGAAAADLTARAGTLGPAIALHLINNASAILIAAPRDSFDGLALYTYPFTMADIDALAVWMPVDSMVLLCSWLAARLALRR